MSEPTKNWNAGDQINAADLNQNFVEALNNYRDFTYGEAIAVNDALYLKASDGKVYKTSASYNDERIHNFVGFAKEAGVLDDVKKVQINGKVSGFTGLTIGVEYFLSDTPGAISTTPGTYEKKVGRALSSTELFIEKESLEYLGYVQVAGQGSWSIGSVPAETRLIILEIWDARSGDATTGKNDLAGQIILTKLGCTSNQIEITRWGSSGGGISIEYIHWKASWSGSTITGKTFTISDNATDSDYTDVSRVRAYFYS